VCVGGGAVPARHACAWRGKQEGAVLGAFCSHLDEGGVMGLGVRVEG